MPDAPAISIVLPTHNGSRYLRESVESCRSQTCRDWELVIVDDASTDDTPRILAELAAAEPRIRVIRNGQNRKLPASLNVGFRAARGRFFTWTSDDNRFRPAALEEMMGALESAPAEVGVVYAGSTLIDEDGAARRDLPVYQPAQLGFRGNVVGACFLFRRELFKRVGGYAEDLFLVEDYHFWLCAARHSRFQAIGRNLYEYRVHDASLSTRFPGQNSAGETAFRRALEGLGRAESVLAAGIHFSLALWYAQRRMGREARRELAAAVTTAPLATLRNASPGQLAAVARGRLG